MILMTKRIPATDILLSVYNQSFFLSLFYILIILYILLN